MLIPRLIQRGEIREPVKDPRVPLSQAVILDFMGPSHFAPWVWKRSLRVMAQSEEFAVLTAVNILENSKRLQVYHLYGQEEFAKYFSHLMDMRIGKLQPLVRSHFAICKAEDKKTTDFWWDLENHVIWSFNEDFMTGVKNNIQESYKAILDADSKGEQ